MFGLCSFLCGPHTRSLVLGSVVFSVINLIKPMLDTPVVDITLGNPHQIVFQYQLALFVTTGFEECKLASIEYKTKCHKAQV